LRNVYLRELRVDIDGIEAGDEVNEDSVQALGNLLQQTLGDLFVGRVL
jgi:hypothetical protein